MNSIILRTATRLVVALMLIFSLFLLWRGHNLPGGGFIGSLVAATAFALYSMSDGPAAVRRALRIDPRLIAVGGLMTALVAGLLAALAGQPFLTGLWHKIPLGPEATLPLGTPLLFDIGVYFTVLGAVLSLLLALEESEDDDAAGD